jgi:hypothetical protein
MGAVVKDVLETIPLAGVTGGSGWSKVRYTGLVRWRGQGLKRALDIVGATVALAAAIDRKSVV